MPTLRARPASVTYIESGQPPLTRKALLVEDDDEAKRRVGGTSEIPMETFGGVGVHAAPGRTRGASASARP